jgi:hypothetical protein
MIAVYIPVFFMQETYLKIILTRRKEKQEAMASPQAKPPTKTLLLGVLFITLLRPLKMLVSEPIVAFLALYVAFNFAVLFTFFGSIPYVFESVYHFHRGESGLVFLAIGLGCTLAIPTLVILDKTFYQKELKRRMKRVFRVLYHQSKDYGRLCWALLVCRLVSSGMQALTCYLFKAYTDLFTGSDGQRDLTYIGLFLPSLLFPMDRISFASMYA